MLEQKKAVELIEQLWYTWSDVGIDTIRAGFRIRAASQGLNDPRSQRVQNLDRYLRYSLPRDVGVVAIDQSLAPICLALIATPQERILVQKVYKEKDGVGRTGSFFVHLLANLPEEFSAREAISLWKSGLWKTSDTLDRRTISLESIPLADVQKASQQIRPHARDAYIRQYLPYMIQAYLTKKPLKEHGNARTVPQKIYVAAPDNEMALLIAGLTHSLPKQLWKHLTFSTYEHDVTTATTEIIGTCWLSVTGAEQDPRIKNLLPNHYYQEKLALNCYTGEHSSLEQNPLTESRPHAASCASDATEYFLQGNMPEFQDVLDAARDFPDLHVDQFLDLYEQLVIRAQNPSKQDLMFALTCMNHAYSAKMLARQTYQRTLFDLVVHEPDWWQTSGKAAINNLLRLSITVPGLAQVLSTIAQSAISKATMIAQEQALTTDAIAHSALLFQIMVDIILCASPSERDSPVWLSLLQKLAKIKSTKSILSQDWNTFVYLLNASSQILTLTPENNTIIRPLLTVSWNTVGDFLALCLPMEWKQIAIQALLSSQPRSILDEKRAYDLAQSSHPLIKNFFDHLVQDQQRWKTAMMLFCALAESNYPQKLTLLSILLDSPMGLHAKSVEWLVHRAGLTPDEQMQFLEYYGPKYLPLSDISYFILKNFGTLADNTAKSPEKMRVLFHWIESPQLSIWLTAPPQGEQHWQMILDFAHLNTQESVDFFQRCGEKSINFYPNSPKLLKLFETYTSIDPEQPIHFLHVWLKQAVTQKTLESVLTIAQLTLPQKVWLIEHYGEQFLLHYPKSRILLQYVQQFLEYLQNTNKEFFESKTARDESSATENFLKFLSDNTLLPSQSQRIYDWYVIANFIRKPPLREDDLKNVSESIGRLSKTNVVSQTMRVQLLQKLALVCISDEQGPLHSIKAIESFLLPVDLWLMFCELAENVRDGVSRGKYKKELFIPYMKLAFTMKTAFSSGDEQEYFAQNFLNLLLLTIDKKTLDWLNAEARKWPSHIHQQWKMYVPQRLSLSLPAKLSRFERMALRYERALAFTQMRQALKSNSKKIVRVSTDHMTTLNSYDTNVPNEWWSKIDEAWNILNLNEELTWQIYESQQSRAISLPTRRQHWWDYAPALLLMWLALKTEHIGSIVRVATDHMITLETYKTKVPKKWWVQIAVAFNFFQACEEANQQALVLADKQIELLVEAGYPAPKLTMHEELRIRAANRALDEYARRNQLLDAKNWIPKTYRGLTSR